MVALFLLLLNTDISPVLADLQSHALLRPEKAARVALPRWRFAFVPSRNNTSDSSNNSVLIDDDRAVERRGIARELRGEITQAAAYKQA